MNEYIQSVIDEGIDVPCAVDEQNRYVRKDGIVGTLTTDGSSPKHNNRVIVAAAMRGRYNEDGQVEQHLEVSDREVANTVTTVQKDSLVAEPNVLVPKRTEYGKAIRRAYEAGEIQESRHNMTELVPRTDGIANTLTTVQKDNYVAEPTLRIRKLTPKECFRLQGFDDESFHRAEAVNSNTQLYKQAGNSICVPVVEYIIKALLDCGALQKEKENKEMELRVEEYQLPERIGFNFEELKAELTEKVSMYETMVYTDDQIRLAKEDRANLNKLKKALNDERIRREKEYMVPFNAFKSQVNEIISIIDKPVAVIDLRVKEFEDKQKQAKLEQIKEFFVKCNFHDFRFEQIFDEKWLNSSVSMKSIEEAICAKGEQIATDLATLSNLPEFGFEAVEVYKSTLDINRAIAEAQKMSQIAKAKAEHERLKAEAEAKAQEQAPAFEACMNKPEEVEVTDKPKTWVKFAALLTVDQAMELKKFFDDRLIEFKAV